MPFSKTILLDVDGCIADFIGPLFEQATKGRLQRDELTTWDCFSLFDEKEKKAAERVLNSEKFWLNQPVFDGAQDGVKAVQSAGFDVLYATSPWWSCKMWGHARRAWLKEHFGAGPRETIISPRKDMLRGISLIDDKPSHVNDWAAANPDGLPYLFQTPHNARDTTCPHPRMLGWHEVQDVISKLRAKGSPIVCTNLKGHEFHEVRIGEAAAVMVCRYCGAGTGVV